MTKEGSFKIVNFMTPGAGVLVLGHGHISHIVKLHYFFKNLLLYSQALIRQTKYVLMMTKEGATKIVNFLKVIIVNMHFFFSINILHIDCYCVKGLWCCFPIQSLIFIYYNNWAVDMQICTLLTRIQCKVPDTQVTVKACGPLVVHSAINKFCVKKNEKNCCLELI